MILRKEPLQTFKRDRQETDDTRANPQDHDIDFPLYKEQEKENKKERTRTSAKCAAAYCIPRFRTKDQEEYQEKKLPMMLRRSRR
jgi:hypothetical protein